MQFQVDLLDNYSSAFYSVVKIVYLGEFFFFFSRYIFRIETQYKKIYCHCRENYQTHLIIF